MDNKEHLMKFKKYEDEMKQYLISKYFSDNTVLEDVKDGQPSAADRLPLYQSLQDHKTFLELIREEPSASSETTTSGNSNREPSIITDNKEHLMKFRKYENEMKQYLISKYFSDNAVLEDVKDGQPSAADRLPLYQSLQDHKTFLELIREEPSASSETTTSGNSEGELSIIMDTNIEHIEKFKKYEAEVKEYLKKKYFSDNTILEGVKDGQRSATDRLPLYQSLQEHKTFLELIREKPSASGETIASGHSKGKPST